MCHAYRFTQPSWRIVTTTPSPLVNATLLQASNPSLTATSSSPVRPSRRRQGYHHPSHTWQTHLAVSSLLSANASHLHHPAQ